MATNTPDDVLYEALAGTPDNLAIPGYHPQVSSELYTTNGEVDGHAAERLARRGWRCSPRDVDLPVTSPEQDPGRRVERGRLPVGLQLPRRRETDQQEFAKNIPFAPSSPRIAVHRPVVLRGRPGGRRLHPGSPSPRPTRAAPTRRSPSSYASRCATKGVEVPRQRRTRPRHEAASPWRGGEMYGGEDNLY
ncbi:hypothetical protein LV779_32935 [Streptomyces thinghirensis]|nr:hypothetical protein [Streptomyces thinghirensis]